MHYINRIFNCLQEAIYIHVLRNLDEISAEDNDLVYQHMLKIKSALRALSSLIVELQDIL